MERTIRILIVDGVQRVHENYRTVLSGYGYHVETAQDRSEALERLGEAEFDLVLLELGGGAEGMQLLGMLKRQWPGIEVVATAGDPSIESAKEAVRLGAFDYLPRPLDPRRLALAAAGAIRNRNWTIRVERSSEEEASNGGARAGCPAQAH